MGLACEHVAEIENIICTMDGGKKQPELFKANLFSPSGGLSLGLGDESFSSPLSLAPALGAAASQTPNSKCALIGTTCDAFMYTCTECNGTWYMHSFYIVGQGPLLYILPYTLLLVIRSKLQFSTQ